MPEIARRIFSWLVDLDPDWAEAGDTPWIGNWLKWAKQNAPDGFDREGAPKIPEEGPKVWVENLVREFCRSKGTGNIFRKGLEIPGEGN